MQQISPYYPHAPRHQQQTPFNKYILWKTRKQKLYFLYQTDTYKLMYTCNLLLHQYISTQYTYLFEEYIQYDDTTPFKPTKLSCSVSDYNKIESENGKITSVVIYWTRYYF